LLYPKKQVPLSISIRDAASLFFLIAQGGLFVKEFEEIDKAGTKLELDIQLT
jgi:hypothetical protein